MVLGIEPGSSEPQAGRILCRTIMLSASAKHTSVLTQRTLQGSRVQQTHKYALTSATRHPPHRGVRCLHPETRICGARQLQRPAPWRPPFPGGRFLPTRESSPASGAFLDLRIFCYCLKINNNAPSASSLQHSSSHGRGRRGGAGASIPSSRRVHTGSGLGAAGGGGAGSPPPRPPSRVVTPPGDIAPTRRHVPSAWAPISDCSK